MKENITEKVGTCSKCYEKYQQLDDSGRCESCFDDPTEEEARKLIEWYERLTEDDK